MAGDGNGRGLTSPGVTLECILHAKETSEGFKPGCGVTIIIFLKNVMWPLGEKLFEEKQEGK